MPFPPSISEQNAPLSQSLLRTGECAVVPAVCQDARVDKGYCEGRERRVCGEDLIGGTIEHCVHDCVDAQGRATCKRIVCGDGVPEGDEACDDGNTVTETAATACGYGETRDDLCNANCTGQLHLVGPYCGDNVVNGPEICDATSSWCRECRIQATVAAGGDHTCAVTSDGVVSCWGSNAFGQRGTGGPSEQTEPADVSGLGLGAFAVSGGSNHTCALTSAGAAMCWGLEDQGLLGNGGNTSQTAPVAVAGLNSGLVALSAGAAHTCAVTSNGAAVCWGSGDQGQLGNGDRADQDEPVQVSGLSSGVVSVAAGGRHTCAVSSEGAVLCWGDNAEGQLGYGGSADQDEPVGVSGLSSGVVAVAAGAYHTCAVTTQGAVLCWGWDNSGQLGNGIDSGSRRVPVAVSGLTSGVATVSANGAHACALTFEGAVQCWGDGRSGQLGDGQASNRTAPVAVSGLSSGVVSVSAGTRHTCALTSEAVVKCWGDGSSGQLGSNVGASYVPLDVGTVIDETDAGLVAETTVIDTSARLDASANDDASVGP